MKKRFFYIALIVISAATIIYSCSTNSAVKPTPGAGSATAVSIQGFAFAPETVNIKTGGTITWTNKDSDPHTVTEIASLFDSGALATSQTFTHTFNTPGTYTYHCLIHSMMKSGTVVVTN